MVRQPCAKMSLELLPMELYLLILRPLRFQALSTAAVCKTLGAAVQELRDEIRDSACVAIQKCWGKFQAPKNIAKMLTRNWVWTDEFGIGAAFGHEPYVFDPETMQILEYCVKVLSGKEDPAFWQDVLRVVDFQLWMNAYNGGAGVRFYIRAEEAQQVLSARFRERGGHDDVDERYLRYL